MGDNALFLYSDRQEKLLAIVTKLAALASFVSGLYMIRAAWTRRDQLYHRLILGLSIHLLSYSIWQMIGTFAVPSGTEGVWGAVGNTQTCTAQGFFIQVALCVPLYYVSISLYSFQAIRVNFRLSDYEWVEKWIHLCVHIFPVGSAFFLLTQESFNSNGHSCWVSSIPFGCGTSSGIECERGPQNIELVLAVFLGIPLAIVVFFPILTLATLYYNVWRRRSQIKLKASTVAKQSMIYLLALFACFSFFLFDKFSQTFWDRRIYWLDFAGQVSVAMVGVYILGFYVWVQSKSKARKSVRTCKTNLSMGESNISEISKDLSFNIFDGSNADGAFAQYVFDADSDDEEEDRRQSVQWNAVQDHV